jgi:hypothetical protein
MAAIFDSLEADRNGYSTSYYLAAGNLVIVCLEEFGLG